MFLNTTDNKFDVTVDLLKCEVIAAYRNDCERARAHAEERLRLINQVRRYGSGALNALRREIAAASAAGAALARLITRTDRQ